MDLLFLYGKKKNYKKGKIYPKQLLLKDTFTVKRYGKGLLVQIEEEELYKIIRNKEFTNNEDSLFEKIELDRNLIHSGGRCTVEIGQNSQKRK